MADTPMPDDLSVPATKADLRAMRSDLTGDIRAARKDLSAEIGAVRGDLTLEIAAVRKDLSAEIGAVRKDLSAEIGAVRVDLTARIDAVRADLTADIGSLRTELAARLDQHDLRFERLEGNLHRLNVGFARMEGDMTEMKGKIDVLIAFKEDFGRFTTHIERMTGYFESCVRRMESQGAMLMEHEGRLTRIESRLQ